MNHEQYLRLDVYSLRPFKNYINKAFKGQYYLIMRFCSGCNGVFYVSTLGGEEESRRILGYLGLIWVHGVKPMVCILKAKTWIIETWQDIEPMHTLEADKQTV